MSSEISYDELSSSLHEMSLRDRMFHVRAKLPGKIVFTTSLGSEDQIITHLIFSLDLDIQVVTLDTGRLFPETYDLLQQVEERYGKQIKVFYPDATEVEQFVCDNGINGFRKSVQNRKICCNIRKVSPLRRALCGANVWITGLRAEQSDNRSSLTWVSCGDADFGTVKVNPMLDWTLAQVTDYIYAHDIPYNKLHDAGFISIGCQPCTRAVHIGEHPRAGRWWWEHGAQECGLHSDNHNK